MLPHVDGLVASWQEDGLVFVNPPYGHGVKKWIKKIVSEAAAGAEILALLPARTGTIWFHDLIAPTANSIILLKGRLVFIDGTNGNSKNPATFDSMVVYWGPRVAEFQSAFGDKGLLWHKATQPSAYQISIP